MLLLSLGTYKPLTHSARWHSLVKTVLTNKQMTEGVGSACFFTWNKNKWRTRFQFVLLPNRSRGHRADVIYWNMDSLPQIWNHMTLSLTIKLIHNINIERFVNLHMGILERDSWPNNPFVNVVLPNTSYFPLEVIVSCRSVSVMRIMILPCSCSHMMWIRLSHLSYNKYFVYPLNSRLLEPLIHVGGTVGSFVTRWVSRHLLFVLVCRLLFFVWNLELGFLLQKRQLLQTPNILITKFLFECISSYSSCSSYFMCGFHAKSGLTAKNLVLGPK